MAAQCCVLAACQWLTQNKLLFFHSFFFLQAERLICHNNLFKFTEHSHENKLQMRSIGSDDGSKLSD